MKYSPLFFLCIALTGFAEEPVRVAVDRAVTVHTMKAGIGCNFHAIETPLPYDETRTWAGSVWGANPDPEDEAGWQAVYRHLDWLGLDWARLGLTLQMWEPERGKRTPEGREMRILYRYLEYFQSRKVDVYLQHFFHNTQWLSKPEHRSDPVKVVRGAPADIEAFTDSLAALTDHVVRVKGYTCVRQMGLMNEPFENWSWYIRSFAPDTAEDPLPAMRLMRAKLDRLGLGVQFTGPDVSLYTTHPVQPHKKDFFEVFQAYDFHQYLTRWDWEPRDTTYVDGTKCQLDKISEAEEQIARWRDEAAKSGKPVFASEMGTFMYGFARHDAGIISYLAVLKDFQSVVRFSNVGIDGFARWNFLNRGDLDGPWQMLTTWDIANGKLLPTEKFTPNRAPYFMWGALSRFTAKHSRVVRTDVEGGKVAGLQRVFAATFAAPGSGRITTYVINDAEQAFKLKLSLGKTDRDVRLYRLDEAFLRGTGSFGAGENLGQATEWTGEIAPRSVLWLTEQAVSDGAVGVICD
ncbi:hypothetical protein [Nibricoccus sp. IMCC34717]|uniref:hypothetical protein n=1 Tax=Nibricoccus sp. IMCC34717 TaxID=3034021 RepID=UPI003850F430